MATGRLKRDNRSQGGAANLGMLGLRCKYSNHTNGQTPPTLSLLTWHGPLLGEETHVSKICVLIVVPFEKGEIAFHCR